MSHSLCLVTSEYNGPWKNGGIGTAFRYLAEFLRQEGYQVTVLYTASTELDNAVLAHWQEALQQQGITFVPLMTLHQRFPQRPPEGNAERSFHVYQWLKEHHFDLIHFHDYQGLGYHSIKAKRQGLAFQQTPLVVQMHGSHSWAYASNALPVDTIDTVATFFQEKTSIALADAVISPSRYMLDWCRQQGWQLPERALMVPNLYEETERLSSDSEEHVTELVFFGRLETRKGLELFCRALPQLPATKITFLGKPCFIDGLSTEHWIRQWCSDVPYTMHTDYDQAAALAYLSKPGRLAVIPSLAENAPYTVLECAVAGIPFIATNVGGIPELIDSAYHDRCLCEPTIAALTATLKDALQQPVIRPQIALHLSTVKEQWRTVHHTLLALPPLPAKATAQPLVSVCLVHYNRPHYLQQALASIEAQAYPTLEVILVDDGSTDPAALDYLAELEPYFQTRGWQIIRQQNAYLGAARNTAVRHARGVYVKFMDDDNIAARDEIATMVKVAEHTNADIVTCCLRSFESAEPPANDAETVAWVPIGADSALGVLVNSFGDANSLMKKTVFTALGGFTEDYGVGHEDWELYAKAQLAGYHIELIPETLFYYRVTPGSMQRVTHRIRNHARNIRPYLARYPELASLLQLTQGLFDENKRLKETLAAMPQGGCRQALIRRVKAVVRRILGRSS